MSTKTDAARIINKVIPDALTPYADSLRSMDVTPETAWDVCRELTSCLSSVYWYTPVGRRLVNSLHSIAVSLLVSYSEGVSLPVLRNEIDRCVDVCEDVRRAICPAA